MAKLFANSEDPDQTLPSAASDLGLHCLPSTRLRVSRLVSNGENWDSGISIHAADILSYFP